jgi:hypothetical protein
LPKDEGNPQAVEFGSWLGRRIVDEGWFGDDYFVLFTEDEAISASERYRVGEALPGCTIVGLRNWDDFIVRDRDGSTYTVPTVPLAAEHMEQIEVPSAAALQADGRFVGKVKWYVTPLVFGGDPEAARNVAWVTHVAHGELVAWWNAKYRELRSR